MHTTQGLYKNLWALLFFLLLGLGACTGSSKRTRSSNHTGSLAEEEDASVRLPKECEVENGKGNQNWNPSLGDWDSECKVIACKAGYYRPAHRDACVKETAGVSFSAKQSHTCIILDDDGDVSNGGPVKCWGQISNSISSYIDIDSNPSLGNKPDGSAYMATFLASGQHHACAILDDDGDVSNGGPIKCWGYNGHGQTGGGSPSLGNKADGSAYMAISLVAGHAQTCAILDDDGDKGNGGPVKCWGRLAIAIVPI